MHNELYKYMGKIRFKWRADEEVKYTVKQKMGRTECSVSG